MPSVAYVFPKLHKFRVPFHEHLKRLLADHNVDYMVYYTEDTRPERKDLASLTWGTTTPLYTLPLFLYQAAFSSLHTTDLVIVQQENKLLLNYFLQILRPFRRQKIAFFGHGKNFQSAAQNGWKERWKRFWLTRVDWWFAYTDGSAALVEQAGFPKDKITVFQNAIDVSQIKDEMAHVSEQDIQKAKNALGIYSDNIGIYIGGMYPEKRLSFLIEAALKIRQDVPDFHLIMMGAGEDVALAEDAAAQHDFIHYTGPTFGQEKTTLAMSGKVFLMPGLVGLAVLDSFAYGLPMVTTDIPVHSPEIDYLKDGVNGVIVKDAYSTDAYAQAVSHLLTHEDAYTPMKNAALASSEEYSIENMAERFAQGVLQALKQA